MFVVSGKRTQGGCTSCGVGGHLTGECGRNRRSAIVYAVVSVDVAEEAQRIYNS